VRAPAPASALAVVQPLTPVVADTPSRRTGSLRLVPSTSSSCRATSRPSSTPTTSTTFTPPSTPLCGSRRSPASTPAPSSSPSLSCAPSWAACTAPSTRKALSHPKAAVRSPSRHPVAASVLKAFWIQSTARPRRPPLAQRRATKAARTHRGSRRLKLAYGVWLPSVLLRL
jgi:hypothetical protein